MVSRVERFALVLTAHGSNLSQVPDGGVLFMVWSMVASPLLSAGTMGLGMAERVSRKLERKQCYPSLGGSTGQRLPLIKVATWVARWATGRS